jgi:enoyl-CoA hydratase/carnithine racemase
VDEAGTMGEAGTMDEAGTAGTVGEAVWSGRFVRLEIDGGIGTIRLDRPKLNALDAAMQEEIRVAAGEAASRPEIAAVVVYGGERVFAAGADVKQMQAMSHAEMVERSGALQSAFGAVAQIPKPTVAAVTGYALGGGCELALCCDVRVAGESATLGQPEILLGIIPGAGGTQRLARLIGPARAKDLIFSGRFVAAAEALALGLVDEVVPDDQVYAAARRRVRGHVGGPALALRAAKEAIDRGLDVGLAAGLEIEREQFAALFGTRDREIGMASFVEQGPGKAVFEGR